MSSQDPAEIALRKRAIRLTIQGKRPTRIARSLHRTRQWLYKWQERFAQKGWKGLEGESRCPHYFARAYEQRARRVVLSLRPQVRASKGRADHGSLLATANYQRATSRSRPFDLDHQSLAQRSGTLHPEGCARSGLLLPGHPALVSL